MLPNWLPVAIVSAWQSYKFASYYLLNNAFLFLERPIDLRTSILSRLSSVAVSRFLPPLSDKSAVAVCTATCQRGRIGHCSSSIMLPILFIPRKSSSFLLVFFFFSKIVSIDRQAMSQSIPVSLEKAYNRIGNNKRKELSRLNKIAGSCYCRLDGRRSANALTLSFDSRTSNLCLSIACHNKEVAQVT